MIIVTWLFFRDCLIILLLLMLHRESFLRFYKYQWQSVLEFAAL